MKKPSLLWKGSYLSLWNDGEIIVFNGVAFVGFVKASETRKLYEALRKYYGDESRLNGLIEEQRALLISKLDHLNQLKEGLQND